MKQQLAILGCLYRGCSGRFAAILLLLVGSLFLCSPLFGADGQIDLLLSPTATTIIGAPGSYVVVANVTMTDSSIDCIQINASDVTVNFNGHTLIGAGGTGAGINQTAGAGARVLNGRLKDFGGGGILLGDEGAVEDMRVSYNGPDCIRVGADSQVLDNTVRGCTSTQIRVTGPAAIIARNYIPLIDNGGCAGVGQALLLEGSGCGSPYRASTLQDNVLTQCGPGCTASVTNNQTSTFAQGNSYHCMSGVDGTGMGCWRGSGNTPRDN